MAGTTGAADKKVEGVPQNDRVRLHNESKGIGKTQGWGNLREVDEGRGNRNTRGSEGRRDIPLRKEWVQASIKRHETVP